jgi:hypothetical protein
MAISMVALAHCFNKLGYEPDEEHPKTMLGEFFATVGLLVGTMAASSRFLDSKSNILFYILQYFDSILRGSGQVSERQPKA